MKSKVLVLSLHAVAAAGLLGNAVAAAPPTSLPIETITIVDDTGTITVDVPATWAEHDTAPNPANGSGNIWASPDLDVFRIPTGGMDPSLPGVYLIDASTASSLENLVSFLAGAYKVSCTAGEVEPFEREDGYVGLIQTFAECDGTGNSRIVAGATSPAGTAVLANIQLTDPADPALDVILDSFAAVAG